MSKRTQPLTDSQRAYLDAATEPNGPDPGELDPPVSESYRDRPDKLHAKIQNRTETLPTRVDALLEEIELLAGAGYLDTEERPNLEEYLTLFHGTDTEKHSFESNREDLTTGIDSSPSLFGERLASAASRLLVFPAHVDESDATLELAVGFLGWLIDRTDGGRELLTELSELVDAEQERRDRLPEIHAEGVVSPEYIANILRENDIDPTFPLIAEVDNSLSYEGGEGPTEQQIMAAAADLRATKREMLRRYIRADLRDLDDREWNGVSGLSVIRAVADAGGLIRDVADEINSGTDIERRRAIPTVGRFTRFLSGEQIDGWGQRDAPPVFYLDESGEDIPDWSVKLTDYGRVLGASAAWMPMPMFALTGVPEELIKPALDGLNG
jgi:hypothetical protein